MIGTITKQRRRVLFTKDEVEQFARGWPMFGKRGPLLITFAPSGDVTDICGDDGMDPFAVSALCDDAAKLVGFDNPRADLRWMED